MAGQATAGCGGGAVTGRGDEMTRLDALRALLALHEPVPDDRRTGHRYIYAEPDAKVRMDWRARMKARVDKIRRMAS